MTNEFSVNFGDAKIPELLAPGTYVFKITDYEPKQLAKEENRHKGFNIAMVLEAQNAEGSGKMWWNLYVHRENPWAAKLFFEALTGQEFGDDFDMSDPNDFLGELVGCAVHHEPYEKNGQTKFKLAPVGPDAWYTV